LLTLSQPKQAFREQVHADGLLEAQRLSSSAVNSGKG